MVDVGTGASFSFTERPTPVPGDLRINWRLAILLMILDQSRSKRASLAKLYMISDAVKSRVSYEQLRRVMLEDLLPLEWTIRVEPALARAVDLLVGEGLAKWTEVASRIGIEITPLGDSAATSLAALDDIFMQEREVVAEIARPLTETKVTAVLRTHGSF